MNLNLTQTFKKIMQLFTPQEHKKANLLILLIIIMAFLEMIGVASIMPFMAVLINPDIIQTNNILNTAYQSANVIGIDNYVEFLFALGILVLFLLFASLSIKALTTYAQMRFIYMSEYSLSKRLVERYLQQPYDWFLNRHSADLGKSILSEVDRVISGGLNTMINFIAQSLVAFAILMLLIFVDLKLALIVGLTLGSSYALIYKFTRSILKRTGNEVKNANKWRFTAVSEAFGAVKEIKIGSFEKIFIQRFSGPAKIYGFSQLLSQLVIQLPRFALEGIAFGGLLIITLFLMTERDTFSDIIPVISLYAFAGYRLMPAMQQIYNSLSGLRFIEPMLESIHKELITLQIIETNNNHNTLIFENNITLSNVNYHYPNTSRTALKNINLKISAGTTVGIVGATGCGKTTTVDIIMGLLEPQHGLLRVDGIEINKNNVRTWQRLIGYVPQQIYLADDTIEGNIAFGVNPKFIDQRLVEYSAKIANLHEFVSNELPKKYQTTVGERGVRLSGGQRQRIGIARAIYRKPKILILDEATSALDNLTERAVMDEVHNISGSITIIIIAHRLSTVKKCDNIFFLKSGELTDQGTYKKLIQTNDRFRETAFDI